MSITVTRTSTTQFRIVCPITVDRAVEFRMKVNSPYTTWGLQGMYGLDLDTGDYVQLSDPTDTSVSEYALGICVAAAPRATFDYVGMAHGHETPTALTMTLDGVSVLGWTTAQTATGTTFVVTQAMNMRLPKNADGTANDVTVCGSGTCVHTFTEASQLSCAHTHILLSGYEGFGWYAAACAINAANFDRVQIQGRPTYTLLHDGSLSLVNSVGYIATGFQAWDTSAHPYRVTLTLPSGGPDINAVWTYAVPELTYFEDGTLPAPVGYAKWRVLYIGTPDTSRQAGPFLSSHVWALSVSLVDAVTFDQDVFDTDVFMQDTGGAVTLVLDAATAAVTLDDEPVTVLTLDDELLVMA